MTNNIKDITACPPTEELRQLLGTQLSGERQQEYTDHLDRCPCCQNKLEELATEGTNLSSVVEHLNQADPVATSAYWPAIREIDAAIAQAAGNMAGMNKNAVVTPPPVERKPRKKDATLDFLDPPTDPSYLGRLAHFDVMRILGRGGMGVVLEAFDSKLQRHVAIKVLDPELAEEELSKQRFCREARSAASVTHENVVAVHQVEKVPEKGIAFLVMQLISGETLEQRLQRETKLPLAEIVRISMEASRGLAAAHSQGLIHRDIKPGNILLEPPTQRVKLTDFGLARIAEDVKLTRTGFVSGTPLYMAPEQAMGAEPDPRSDLFSLGAIMYEMAAGQPPFTGSSALAILKQITEVKHRPLKEVNPNVPEWFAEIVDDLLAKKPADRYDTANDLAEVLEYHWAHLKTSSEDLPSVCQIELKRRRTRNTVVISAVGAALLAVGLIVGSMFNGGVGKSNPAVPVAAKSSAEPIAVLSANAGTVWSASFDPKSETIATGIEDGSVRLWDLKTKSVKSTLEAHSGLVWHVQFAPDGRYLATTGDDSKLKIWKVGEAKPLQTFAATNAIRGLAISQDGSIIFAGGRDGSVYKFSPDASEPLATEKLEGSIFTVALSPDGKTLAVAGSGKTIFLLDADTFQPKLKLEKHAGQIYGLAFHKDGHLLASAGWDKTIRLWNVGTGLVEKEWAGESDDLWDIAFSPDGTKLATAGGDRSAKLWDAATGKLLATYLGHTNSVHGVNFNADGTLLISGSRDGSARVWPVK
ncbi:WD40 repeat domain-containing serine/threonine protein kinase [Anatilimnocola floriformis]|uniref:WD40 repeat domain-containing serine/threonine protein kinase n=1 Tax=Anatilimnocola floriformis TaxID=2948575 RepID=UPI0020C4D6E8|nr:serine/threonine-protein kinase [Anatilimnocola floriformis]